MDDKTTSAKPRWRRWLVEGLIVLAVIGAVSAYRSAGLAEGEAPPFSGRTVAGEPFSLEQFRGEPAVVYFWASWCPVCRANRGAVEAVSNSHQVITVAMEEFAAAAGYVEEHDVAYPVLVDANGRIAGAFNVRGVPTTFIVDGDGTIRFASVGYITRFGLRARLWWARVF